MKHYKNLLFALLYLCMASVSCWATAESLHMSLPSWPTIICYIVAIVTFLLASFGLTWIVSAFDKYNVVEHRWSRLVGGFLVMICFWLVFSMPTNTHTLFFRKVISDVVTDDLSTTKYYLNNLSKNVKTENLIKEQQDKLQRDVDAILIALNNEIDNAANPGFGDRAQAQLIKLAEALGVKEIPTLSYRTTAPAQLKALKEQYRKLVYEQLENRKQQIDKNIRNNQEGTYKKEAKELINNIDIISAEISNMKIQGEIDDNIIKQADAVIRQGYNCIRNYKQFINFDSEEQEQRYTADELVTNTSRMFSVFDVWKDYQNGKFAGMGFFYWILVSILVDIAGFILFALAFKKSEL